MQQPVHDRMYIAVAILQEMRGSLPKDIAVPASVALPFGTFERVLAEAANKEAAKVVKAAQKELVSSRNMRRPGRSPMTFSMPSAACWQCWRPALHPLAASSCPGTVCCCLLAAHGETTQQRPLHRRPASRAPASRPRWQSCVMLSLHNWSRLRLWWRRCRSWRRTRGCAPTAAAGRRAASSGGPYGAPSVRRDPSLQSLPAICVFIHRQHVAASASTYAAEAGLGFGESLQEARTHGKAFRAGHSRMTATGQSV